tara:strand:- start:19 stop:975 length:957 start_codon:yes stop_codon:yes gene_type:complete
MQLARLKQLVPESIRQGARTASAQMSEAGDYSHTVLQPKFYKDLAKGSKTRQSITPHKTPLKFAGAVGARLLTDLGEDATRRFYWHYNHPMPIADRVAEQIIGGGYVKDIRPTQAGGTGRFGPTDRSLIRFASIGLPVGASLGHLDLTNPSEAFRAKGYKQKYADEGSEDRRQTTQVGPELIDRVFLGRRGRPLKYETAKVDIPDLTPERYGNYMHYAYQNKGLTGLGLLKGTGANLEGKPEVSVVGFPFGLQSGGALAGGAIGLRQGLRRPGGAGKIAGRGGAYALAGALAGKLSNMAIASANRPSYPSTLDYQQRM